MSHANKGMPEVFQFGAPVVEAAVLNLSFAEMQVGMAGQAELVSFELYNHSAQPSGGTLPGPNLPGSTDPNPQVSGHSITLKIQGAKEQLDASSPPLNVQGPGTYADLTLSYPGGTGTSVTVQPDGCVVFSAYVPKYWKVLATGPGQGELIVRTNRTDMIKKV